MGGPIRKIIQATREITLNLGGREYDVWLIPKDDVIEMDFVNCPEDDPLRRHVNAATLSELDIDPERDLVEIPGTGKYRLRQKAAKRLLESL